ncbi:MAG TPA: ATP-binding cassette domain-containing protein [Frankiaceae bacterium]|nr:ATP-binding cassette domain-containing protein [Frankiaceae bacterium]
MLSTLVNGAIAGAIYSLIGCGLVLTYSSTGVFNLGYGAIAYVAGLLFYELNLGLHWNRFLVAILIVFVFCPLLGLLLDRMFFRPLSRASEAAKVVGTVGVLIGLPALAQFVIEEGRSVFHWGIPTSQGVTLTPGVAFTSAHTWHWHGIVFDSNQALVLGASVICALALWGLSHTTLGLQTRAVVDSAQLAGLRGVSEIRTLRRASIIGTSLAGIAGVVGAPVFNSLDPGTWTIAVFIASTAVVVGRFRSVPITFVAGIAIGTLMGLTFRYVHLAKIDGLNNAVPFVLLLGGLLVLGRSKARAGGTASLEVAPVDWKADLPVWRRRAVPAIAFCVVIVWILAFANPLWQSLLLRGAAFSLIMLSICIVTGLGGMISLAQSSFAMVASLSAGLLINRYHVPLGVALIAAVAIAMLLGLIVGLPAIRVGGMALALATLALAFLCSSVLFAWRTLTNGDTGWTFNRPFPVGLHFSQDRIYGAALLVINLLVIWTIRNLTRSSTGRAIASVRATEVASGSIGISATSAKLRVFVFSAGLAGLGGVLLGTVDGGVTSTTLGTLDGLTWLTVVVLLGVRRPAAAITAGLVFICFPAVLSGGFHDVLGLSWHGTQTTQIPSILFGLGAAGLARKPEGAFDDFAERRYRRRQERAVRRLLTQTQALPAQAPLGESKVANAARIDTVKIVDRAPAPVAHDPAAALETLALTAGYDSVKVLSDINLRLEPGTLTAIFGANGAGKSTLCSALGGAIPIMAGSIHLAGDDITAAAMHLRAGKGLLLAPEGRGIFPHLSVEDNLRLTLRDAKDRDLVYQKFPVLGERARLNAEMLSGGEQQMLALGPLLAKPPKVLIADEPSFGLAPLVVERVLELLLELKSLGTTIFVAEEKPGRLREMADQVVLLSLGRITWQGFAGHLTQHQMRAAYHLEHSAAASTDTRESVASARPEAVAGA